MALIFCPECGIQISEHAQQCTKCSYPIYKLKSNNSHQNNSTHNYYQSTPLVNNISSEATAGLIISGYVVAFLSLLILPLFFLLAGIIIGIVTISKGSIGHGIAHILLSIILGTIGAIAGIIMYLFN